MFPSFKFSRNWTSWFTYRNLFPESDIPVNQWYEKNWNNGWGPNASNYPIPFEFSPDIITISRYYIGLPYQHHHIPSWDPPTYLTGKPDSGRGLDCSNFTSWVYNYGKGRKFTSNVHNQSEMYEFEPGMIRINDFNEVQPGDLLYFWRITEDGEREISHTGIFSGYQNRIPYLIDSRYGEGVKERPITPDTWYYKRFSHAIRIFL